MKRVLVITDNAKLLAAFIQLTSEQGLGSVASIDYRYSANNKAPDLMIALDCKPIDIKDERAVDWTIANFDLVLSIHCKQIFPLELVSRIPCFNLHPGLNPHNRGWYPQIFSIINGRPAGATLHLMNEEVDAGPIVAQEQVAVHSFDTSLSVYERVQEVEIELLRTCLKPLILDELKDFQLPAPGNYNSMDDFRNICKLDLNAVGTLREHIDLLRALTHGNFNNAFFVDDSGNKVFVTIQLGRDECV